MKNREFVSPMSKELKEKGFYSLDSEEKDRKRQEELKNINLKDLEKEIEELEKRL